MTWNPGQYLTYGGHRLRPALDLLSRIPRDDPSTVIDLGCGAGNVTAVLKARWPDAKLIGIDNSPQMLERARREAPDIEWREADVLDWRPDAPVDVLFSNAVLHWIDEAHKTLFPRLLTAVANDGVLAIQMPRNFEEPSHTSLYDAVRAGSWRDRLEPMIREEPVKSAQFYYDLLQPHSHTLDIWETQYIQVVEGEHPVADFVKGSWLKPFLDALAEPERSEFEDDYRRRVKAAYPPQSDGRTLFPFHRLFILAER